MVDKLLKWFRKNKRPLPWRREPRRAYQVWVSEVMLQQTQVSTVIPFYRRWLRRFPTTTKLAEASLDEVLKAWEGLGYYRRARQMHRAAGLIVKNFGGRIPTRCDELKKLPGIGNYTAAAIASLVEGENVLAVDGNVKRVAARLFAIRGNVTERAVRKKLQPMLPRGKAGVFNESLMELGAVLCTPRSPHCRQCPLAGDCRAFRAGRVEKFPAAPRRRSVPHLKAVALVFMRDGKIYLRRRGDKEMLGGLWGFPLLKGRRPKLVGSRLEPVKHAYSHFTISATPLLVREPFSTCGKQIDRDQGTFVAVTSVEKLALSGLDHKILKRLKL